MDYKLNDIVVMKNDCLQCKENSWKIIRMGADIRIKCMKCGKSILLSRVKFNDALVKVNNPIIETHTRVEDIPLVIKETKIGDVVKLRKDYRCKNYRNHLRSWSGLVEEWVVEDIHNGIILKCNDCGSRKVLSFEGFTTQLQNNCSLSKRMKSARKIEKKLLIASQKEDKIREDGMQISRFGNVLKNNDIVMLNDNHNCPNCHKNVYRIINKDILTTNPVQVKCLNCSNLVKNSYNESLEVVNEIDKFNYSDMLYLSIMNKLNAKQRSEYIECPNCKHQYAYLERKSLSNNTYTIRCDRCQEVKTISIERKEFFESIIEGNQEIILELLNKSYKSLINDEKRIRKTNSVFYDFHDAINSDKTIIKLQLIDSTHNHVTVMHEIENKLVEIPYRTENGVIKTFAYKCHFCQTCGVYFDFYSSFVNQLQLIGVDKSDLCILLQKSKNNEASTEVNGLNFETFNSESFLHSLGYRVGYSGLNQRERHKLLKKTCGTANNDY